MNKTYNLFKTYVYNENEDEMFLSNKIGLHGFKDNFKSSDCEKIK